MEIIITITTILITMLIVVTSIIRVYKNNLIKTIKSDIFYKLKHNGILTKEGNQLYFKAKKNKYEVLFYNVSNDKTLIIKNATELIIASNKEKLIKTDIFSNDNKKIIIILPSKETPKHKINNKAVLVAIDDVIFNTYIVNYTKLDELLEVIR